MSNSVRHKLFACQNWLALILLLITAGMLSSCQSSHSNKKTSHPESVKITFISASNINKNGMGEASPLRIMVYQLKQQQAFMVSDFITLNESRDPELTDQVSLIYDTMMLPGEKKEQVIETPEEIIALGIISAYRNISDADWKVQYHLPAPPERSWYQHYFKREEVWQPHIEVRMNNLTTSVTRVSKS